MRFLKLVWECFTVWSVRPTSLNGAQAILSHSAGENSSTKPGIVNKYIASVIRNLYWSLKVPTLVQGELASCLRDIPLLGISLRQAEAPRYLSTLDIALWQKKECDKIGAKRIVLVSYLPHYWRAVKVTEKLGLEVIIPHGITEMFDPNNSQWWARYKWLNRPYEVLFRLYFIWRGWI